MDEEDNFYLNFLLKEDQEFIPGNVNEKTLADLSENFKFIGKVSI